MKKKKASRRDAAVHAFAHMCYAARRKLMRDTKAFQQDLNRITQASADLRAFKYEYTSQLYDLAQDAFKRARDTGEEYVPIVWPERAQEAVEYADEEREDDYDTGHGPFESLGGKILAGAGLIGFILFVIWAVVHSLGES